MITNNARTTVQPTRSNGASTKTGPSIVTIKLDPEELGLFSEAAKIRGHATVQAAVQEFVSWSQEVLDWKSNGFAMPVR